MLVPKKSRTSIVASRTQLSSMKTAATVTFCDLLLHHEEYFNGIVAYRSHGWLLSQLGVLLEIIFKLFVPAFASVVVGVFAPALVSIAIGFLFCSASLPLCKARVVLISVHSAPCELGYGHTSIWLIQLVFLG